MKNFKKILAAAVFLAVISAGSILNTQQTKAVDSLSAPTDVKVSKNSPSDPNYRLQFSYTLPNDPSYSCINIYRNTEFLGGQLSDRVVTCANKGMKLGTETGYFPYDDLYIKDKSSGIISFTIKAVDTAGNESTNTDKYSYSWNTLPFITVLSPNGGEKLTEGQPFTISWKGGPSDDTVIIKLLAPTIQPDWSQKIAEVPNTAGSSYKWNVSFPSAFTALGVDYHGSPIFTIDVTLKKNWQYGDSSDASFSVVAAGSALISEQVTCVFKGSQYEQKCYAASHNNENISCSGKESCVTDINRAKGETVTWKSTCGGYAYTKMDGENESAEFDCSVKLTRPTPPRLPEPIIIDMKYRARDMVDDKYDAILLELKQLRDTVKEQQNEIKYLSALANDLRNISDKIKSAINDFITYGVDANTVRLGAGERAAVINSYKSAFDKLPETEAELTDVIKIANGRFPLVISEKGEKQAKEQFIKIYKRIADMNNANDNAAVKVMAYGLRQKAENRKLTSEKFGISSFKNIYGYTPKSTQDWNTMQAITYSGAKRMSDADKDLLSDEMEEELGTDPYKADTDGDGYGDGKEVNGGFNPLKN